MEKVIDPQDGLTKYISLTPEQYEAAVAFTRERKLPIEYGTHIGHVPNLHFIPRTDEDPETPEWDDKTTAEFEAALA